MEISDVLLQIVVLALLLEAIVQTVKPIWQPEKRTIEFYISLAVGMILAVGVNWLAGLDMFSALGVPLLKAPFVGVILTGILMSRGANVLHDLIKSITLIKIKLQE